MIQKVLFEKLRPLIEAERNLRRRRLAAAVFSVATLAALILLALALFAHWWSWPAVFGLAIGTVIAALAATWWADSRSIDVKEIARRVEESHPDLKLALLTAVEQVPGSGGELGYLQERVVVEAVEHAVRHNWVKPVSGRRLAGAAALQFVALAAFAFATWLLLG
ncbi:MAG: hypothetical protein KDM91_14960, partial [Verrucomicrobiae bacterium]|nr:hypothetical protein [Verrucomicrobiae bacterium]